MTQPTGIPDIPGLVYVQPLGSGGYADVYLFEQQSPRMPVAVKVLKATGLTDHLKRQFSEEADTMAQLGDHPYIVQVFRSGVSTDGRPYLVMKYYPPPNLAARARTERFSVADVLRMGIQLASAVQTAHQASITHRDIKPANVLISAYGAPGLTDFGIAGRGGAHELGESEDVGVSVPWAAPEVLYGQSNGDVRSDIYSLAATLWQLLVGRSPFELPGGDNSAYALMPRIRSTPVPPTGRADVPQSLERVLAHAMAKDPMSRPTSALEFARLLQSVEQEERLPRTQVVVLDDRGQTTLLGQGGAPTGPRPDADDDRTRVKAPQRVQAQRAEDRTGPQGHYLPPSQPGIREYTPPPGSYAPSATPLMHQRYVLPPAPGGAAPPSGPPSLDDRFEVDGETTRRPLPGHGPGAPAAPASPGNEPGSNNLARTLVLVAAGVIAIGGVIVGVLRGQANGSAEEKPQPKVVAGPMDTGIEGVFAAPVLTAVAKPGAVVFTWTYPQPHAKDTFRIKIGEDSSKAASAEPYTTTKATFTREAPAGTTVCAIAGVVRSGQESPLSKPMCETTQ